MAEAAAQMVKTLQEMLDQKNQQLKSKEEMIDKLRQQMLQQREQDGLEISRLTQQLSLTAGTTLSKLQALVQSNQVQAPGGYGAGMSRYDRMTREELSQRITEMD